MTMDTARCGGNHLTKRNSLVRARTKFARFRDVLVIEDDVIEANHLTATLRVLLGYNLEIRRALAIDEAVDLVVEKMPDVVFLDDMPKPSCDALRAIPRLMKSGYFGPVIVVSGQMTHSRRATLLAMGATDVIDRDDIDSVRVAEGLSQSLAPKMMMGGKAACLSKTG